MIKKIKKIKRKKRIHIENNEKKKNNEKQRNLIGCIVLSQKTINKNKTKKFSLNLTKFYLDNPNTYHFNLYQDTSLDSIIKELKIKKEIKEKILFYKDDTIELYIIVVNFQTKIKNYQEKTFFDIYNGLNENRNQSNQSNNNIYNSVYFNEIKTIKKLNYPFTHTNNIFRNIHINHINIKIKLIDIYYYLIGYI